MKKIQHKLLKRKKPEPQISRITNETVAEHRERVLADGKRFKYPHQYLRHRLVINASIIGLVTVIGLVVLGWWQLYVVRSTSDFLYRVTRVVPVPVASVDGKYVRYSDYLMRYRSQEFYLRNQGQLGLSAEDSNRQLDFYKRRVMDTLEFDIYAEKRAEELNIAVTEDDVDKTIEGYRDTATGKISDKAYDLSTKAGLDYSPDEIRHLLRQSLVRQKVAYAIDTTAKKVRDKVAAELEKSVDLQAIADMLKKQGDTVEFVSPGPVSKNNQDSGRAKAALALRDGEISKPIISVRVDEYGYYFVQRLSASDKQVTYQYLVVPLSTLTKEFESIKKSQKIKEYITLKEVKQRTKDN
jgi:hypothetical protein